MIDNITDFCRNFTYYIQLILFLLYHYYNKAMKYAYEVLVEPIYEQFRLKEPIEDQWMQIFCLTNQVNFNEFGWDISSYNSYKKNVLPYIQDFSVFMENEHQILLSDPIIKLPYEYEFEYQAEVVETLLVVKNKDDYLIRSYVDNKERKNIDWKQFPPRSNAAFLYVEYNHPKMRNPVELKIPAGMYLEENELFTPSFIFRCLEYLNVYFYFDMNYEIKYMDSECNEKVLTCNDYLVFHENDYEVKRFYFDKSFDIYSDESDTESETQIVDDDDSTVEECDDDHDDHDDEEEDTEIKDTTSLADSDVTYSGSFWWVF